MKSMRVRVLLTIALLLSVTKAVSADRPVVVAVSEIANLLTQPPAEPGRYNQLLSSIPNLSLLFMAPARMEVEFHKDYIDCLFPASTETMGDRAAFIESSPAQIVDAFVFTLEPETLATLNDTSLIGIRRGFTFGGIRTKFDAKYVELDSDVITAEFLQRGRVDAIIGYLSDVTAAYQALEERMPHYDASAPIYSAREAFVCHKSARNSGFILSANPIIDEWRQRNQ